MRPPEGLGKRSDTPNSSSDTLDKLHVSPRAAILTDKAVDLHGRSIEEVSTEEKKKMRIVTNPLRGKVKKRMPPMDVDFTTAEGATRRMPRDCCIWTVDPTDAVLNWKVLAAGIIFPVDAAVRETRVCHVQNVQCNGDQR